MPHILYPYLGFCSFSDESETSWNEALKTHVTLWEAQKHVGAYKHRLVYIYACTYREKETDRPTDRQTEIERRLALECSFSPIQNKWWLPFLFLLHIFRLPRMSIQQFCLIQNWKEKKKTSLFFFKCRNIRMAFRQSSLFCSTKENIKSDASMPVLLGTWKLEHNSITSL